MVLSDCVCLSHELRLQCTVVGGVTTVWRGSALRDCQYNEIVLQHNRFSYTDRSPAVGECNNGGIVAHGVRRVDNNFTSEININLDVNSALSGNTITCFCDDGTMLMSIGNYTITYPSPTGINYRHRTVIYRNDDVTTIYTLYNVDPHPPNDVYIAGGSTNVLTFSWSPVLPNCSFISYRITSENCGECPTLTHNTSVNCIIITNHTNAALDQMCTFSIQSVVCGNSIGNANISVIAKLKGNIC